MSKFWASSSYSSDNDDDSDDSDNSGGVIAPGTSKFWGSSSSLDDDSDSDTEDSNSDGGRAHNVAGSTTDDAFPTSGGSCMSTPTRQPILPVNDPPEAWRRISPHQRMVPPPTRVGGGADGSPPCTRIVCISDTHGYHRSIPVPTCDILIHGGDFSNYGEPDMIADVSRYFSDLRRNGTVRESIICIAGNHELTFQPEHYDKVWKRFRRPKQKEKYDAAAAREALANCTYLEDESVAVRGIPFYGSPWQPEYYDWAYNAPRADILTKWEQIPSDTDVLVTHGPPLGRGDVTKGNRVGCVSLMKEVQSRVRPRLHVFGHIHEGRGVTHDGTTMYVNASSVTHNYTRQHPGIVVDLPLDVELPAQLVKPDCRLDGDGLLAWLRQEGLEITAAKFEDLDHQLTGKDVVDEPYDELCCRLLIHRDKEAKAELKLAVTKLWLQSFG